MSIRWWFITLMAAAAVLGGTMAAAGIQQPWQTIACIILGWNWDKVVGPWREA